MIRFNVLPATALLCLVVLAQPVSSRSAFAQDAGGAGGGGPGGSGPGGGGSKNRLDAVLSVLRDHQGDASKACLAAMTEVHQTEDQVAGLGQQDSGSTHTDSSADIARDVLDSDYDTAESACRPDAMRACAAQPTEKACARIGAGGGTTGP